MKKLNVLFGSNVRKFRELRDWTQEILSEKLEISIQSLSLIECGKTFPKPENIVKIAQVLNVPCNSLFVGTLIDPEVVKEDFNRRLEIVNNDIERFNLAYEYLKVITD